MANNAKKKLTPVQQEYKRMATAREPARPVVKNCIRAFFVGGLICILGQAITDMFVYWGGFDREKAANPTVAVLIILSVFLTALGVYDKMAQWAGAGTAVPVTGFANSMASAAIESRSEGLVLGVGGKMFTLAGPVIVFGTIAAFVVGIVHFLINQSGAGGGH
ncbi:stage V sporulation protein AC [Cohnella endophytica]|uniref:Stage V sporulation protein AC n=1 Tax=Cohnella endophytica TaxID=2419778 RepID=A0A494X320_9BACL|nr:stage V sporulation protein AC [Cohnella endophytica]RKP45097.1 stage V sporulation protein AC [Cohnella endophytica]